MTYRLAGAAAFPGFDKEFLRQLEGALHTAQPDAGLVEVLGIGRGAGTGLGPAVAGIPALLSDCGLAVLLLPPSLSPEVACVGVASGVGSAGLACAFLASLAPDGSAAYREVGRDDGFEGILRALAETAGALPALPGPLPMNIVSDPSLPIVLVGPMASGKTTLGSLLAKRTGTGFIDLDGLVETQAGQAVSRIFENEGEKGFRLRESEALEEALDRAMPRSSHPGAVIATGGGAVLAERNRALLARRARVVWLHASASVLAARAAADEALPGPRSSPGSAPRRGLDSGPRRPLLSGVDPLARLSALQKERLPFYASVASFLLPVEGRSAYELAEVLHDALF